MGGDLFRVFTFSIIIRHDAMSSVSLTVSTSAQPVDPPSLRGAGYRARINTRFYQPSIYLKVRLCLSNIWAGLFIDLRDRRLIMMYLTRSRGRYTVCPGMASRRSQRVSLTVSKEGQRVMGARRRMLLRLRELGRRISKQC